MSEGLAALILVRELQRMRRTEGRESGRMAAFEALLAVLVASAAGQGELTYDGR